MDKYNERKGLYALKGNPLTLLGPALKVGDKAPAFQVVDNGLKPVNLSDFAGKVIVLSVTPSVDTTVCDLQAKRFNKMATEVSGDVAILNISLDIPYALSRWCAATGSDQIKTLSDYQEREFSLKYGLLVKELKLLARSVWLLDKEGIIRYIEIVPEMAQEPNYEKALHHLTQLVS
ncbi:MAG: thiol peroxidase [Candidatus Zhuqueibacterota bacterium]